MVECVGLVEAVRHEPLGGRDVATGALHTASVITLHRNKGTDALGSVPALTGVVSVGWLPVETLNLQYQQQVQHLAHTRMAATLVRTL
jgi:hypothetical protein